MDELHLVSKSEAEKPICRYTKEEVGKAVSIIAECAKVEVDPKTGQLSIKF